MSYIDKKRQDIMIEFAKKKLCSITQLSKMADVSRMSIHNCINGKSIQHETWTKIHKVVKKYNRIK